MRAKPSANRLFGVDCHI